MARPNRFTSDKSPSRFDSEQNVSVRREATEDAAIARGAQHVRTRRPAVPAPGRPTAPPPSRDAPEGVSGRTWEAVRAAGYQDARALVAFRPDRMGASLGKVTLAELDALHRESVRASYDASKLDPKLVAFLADQRIRPHEARGFIRFCGGKGVGFDWIKDVAFAKLDERKAIEMKPSGWRELLQAPPERAPTFDPRGPREAGRDLLSEGELVALRADPRRAEELLDAKPDSDNVGEMLLLSQALTAKGQGEVALRLAVHAAGVESEKLSETQRYQVQALAPAAAMLAAGQSLTARAMVADNVLVSADAGSRASRVALRGAVAATRQRADATYARACRLHGPGREAALEMAKEQYLRVVADAGLDKAQAKAALGVQSGAAVLDLVRATVVASGSASVAMQVSSPKDAQFDKRTVPAEGAAWLMGSGGVASLVDPMVKGHVLHAWGRLHALHAPRLAFPSLPVGADLFRFDFLLGELRKLAEDVARIEALLTQFKQMLLDQALDKVGLLEGVSEELARLVDGLVKKVEALALEVPGIVDDLVSAARDRAVVIALVEALKAWPHDRWIDLVTSASRDVSNGVDPGTAILNVAKRWLEPDITRILGDVKTQLETDLQALTQELHEAALPQELLDSFGEAAQAAGVTDPSTAILKPLQDALAGIDLVAAARAHLDELDVTEVPLWAEALILAYVAAPLVIGIIAFAPAAAVVGVVGGLIGGAIGAITGGAVGTALGVGAAFSAAVTALLALGVQYLIAVVLRALGDALGLAAQLQALVDRALGQIHDLVSGIMAALADVGTIQGMLAGITSLLEDIEALIPGEVATAVIDALTSARDTVLDNAQSIALATQRAFFRETLEYVDAVPLSFSSSLPQAGLMVGHLDPRYGASAEVAAVASSFETERVLRAVDSEQVLTQVLSLRQLLGSATDLQPLLAGVPLNFAITQADLDRVAPGLHRVLIKDVEVHVDFEVPPETQVALSTILGTADAIAGLRMDPALDGRIPGGGFPALPVVAGRVPTGIPALLTHLGESRVRLKPSQKLAKAYTDECGRTLAPMFLPPTLHGTRLLADPDPEAHAAGWRHLQLLDAQEELLLSHFDVLQDTVRFVRPEKGLKPFEHRGLIGSWRLEVPALVLGSVQHQLPAIRDVRLVVGAVAHYDRPLADLVAQTPVTVVEPTPDATGLGLPGLQSLEDLLTQLDQTVASLADALEDTVAGLGAQVSGLVDVTTQVQGALEDATEALQTAMVVRLSGALATPTTAGTTLQAIVMRTSDLANALDVLKGIAPASWTVSGIDPTKVARVVEVVVTPVTTAGILGGALTLPSSPSVVGFLAATAPSGAQPVTESVTLATGQSMTIPGLEFTSNGATLTNPNGVWTLKLPAGMPLAPASPALTEVLVGILMEVNP